MSTLIVYNSRCGCTIAFRITWRELMAGKWQSYAQEFKQKVLEEVHKKMK